MKNVKKILLVFVIALIAASLFACKTEAVMHTVVFANTDIANVEVADGQKVAEPSAPTLSGQEFAGWYKDAAFTASFDFSVAITANTTVYAKYKALAIKHTVVFANTNLENAQVGDGEQVNKPATPTKEGYEFDDWYIDSAFTTAFDFTQNVGEDITLYARFSVTIPNAITIANALDHDTQTAEKYYIAGTVKSISNIIYGNMVITNGTEDFAIYGVFSADGTLKYEELEERPVVGDKVYLYGVLSKFFETLEMKNSFLMKMEKGEIPPFDLTDYTETTIGVGRTQPVDSKIVVEGVVARVTYANGMSPNGFFLVDATGSIYVYDYDIAASVSAGDTIKVAGTRKNFILEDEVNQAAKLGYNGAIQLAEAVLVSKTSGAEAFDKEWIEEKTVKELLEADPTQVNITGNIYKVNGFVNEVPGLGFTNFYINDLDGKTGSYSYSMNNGNDFSWLRQYDGQLKTVYVAVINAKSTSSGLIYRFIPIEVAGDFVYDQQYNPIFAVKYYGVDQFLNKYASSPDKELQSSVSSEKLGISNVSLSYSSDNTDSVFFENIEGKIIFKTGVPGVAIVTITGTDGDNTYSEVVEITVVKDTSEEDAVTVAEAIAETDETIVIVKGVVGASLVNKTGFYLIDETGVVAVEMVASELDKLNLGEFVVITGIKTHAGSSETALGQLAIREATILVNKYGSHEYSTASFKTGKVLADFIGLNTLEEHSTDVYVFDVTVTFKQSSYYAVYTLTTADGSSMNVYASGASQLTFLEPFKGKEVSVEFTVVNWNGKAYVGSVLSVTYEGVKTVNNSNFRNR